MVRCSCVVYQICQKKKQMRLVSAIWPCYAHYKCDIEVVSIYMYNVYAIASSASSELVA